jgi:hypothetical protein
LLLAQTDPDGRDSLLRAVIRVRSAALMAAVLDHFPALSTPDTLASRAHSRARNCAR